MPYEFFELFGYSATSNSPEAVASRAARDCPFRAPDLRCTKVSATDPIGVCSIRSADGVPTITCPVRFRQDGVVVADAARLAFGPDANWLALPEVPMMTDIRTARPVGKVDWFVVELGEDDSVSDFALVEVQAVYVSGATYKPAFRKAMAGEDYGVLSGHADFRSSHVKRLLPQLSLKVPAVRRWGKKVFVAVDEAFFASFPAPERCEDDNAELTWLVYRLTDDEPQGRLELVDVAPTFLDHSIAALNAAEPPRPLQMIAALEERVAALKAGEPVPEMAPDDD